ncbi:MAG: aminotransferase class I/II-fold pyridoxal phosphate-dependent enzyme [Deltaproteobacteria bacterium]|nr:aminotransferase class I/II-fold pyridoxal phosphate-dependent enzyme [Deltaproteobacteria bacterium]
MEGWGQLTLGTPAALQEPPGAPEVERAFAQLCGLERAVLAPSTLALFWDLFHQLAREPVTLLWDEGLYPVARWGIEHAAARGVPAHSFAHHSPEALQDRLRRCTQRPVVVCDGFCPGCGRPAPLRAYLEAVRSRHGLLVLDDTQALGIHGTPADGAPYGAGGGGSLRQAGISGPDVLCGASLAKAFGAPMAAIAGPAAFIRRLAENSDVRVHCSPPSVPVLQAAARALELNQLVGDELRARLAGLVGRFRERLREKELRALGGLFPVQSLTPPTRLSAADLHQRLERLGTKAVLQRSRCGASALVTFLVTTGHSELDIDQAVEHLAEAIGRPSGRHAQAAFLPMKQRSRT